MKGFVIYFEKLLGNALEKKLLLQKLLHSDGYGNHLDEAAVEEILAGLETSDDEGGSSSGEDDGDDGEMGNLDGGDFDEEAGGEEGDDDDGGGDDDEDDEEEDQSSSEERYFHNVFHSEINHSVSTRVSWPN